MIDDGGPPHEAARCDGDHRCCRCVWMKYRARSRLDGNTLAWVHLLRELHGGRYWTRRCTWSSLPLHYMRAAEGAAHCREDVSSVSRSRYVQTVLVRCRAHPTPGQAAMLARTFGASGRGSTTRSTPCRTRTLRGRRSAIPRCSAGSHLRQDHRGAGVAVRGRLGRVVQA